EKTSRGRFIAQLVARPRPWWERDKVARPERYALLGDDLAVLLFALSERHLSFQDEEQLLVLMMKMKRGGELPWRQDLHVEAEPLGADLLGDLDALVLIGIKGFVVLHGDIPE